MSNWLVSRDKKLIRDIKRTGDHRDSRRAGWHAVTCGSLVIRDIQKLARDRNWKTIEEVLPYINPVAREILKMRKEAISWLKHAPHHYEGYCPSRWTGAKHPREVNSLCLISGHKGQEIPGLVGFDRVVVDAEHMDQALGPATITEIFNIRRSIGEFVYISTNVSETPQIVRDLRTGKVDARSCAALTAQKTLAALQAGADVVKIGFANLDVNKRDLRSEEVAEQMELVRKQVDAAALEGVIIASRNPERQFPLVSVFFPEIGIDSSGERPYEIAEKGIKLTAKAGWQGVLIDTFEKFTNKKYRDFYSLQETRSLSQLAHKLGIEFWIAGSISQPEVPALLQCQVDLICFGGAARYRTGKRTEEKGKRQDQTIKRPLVKELVATFELHDPR
ncbi:MAG TPA: (5-formylfuran-3-yl)methyl phosphate synthase [Terriglobales bacterium]|jgi:uncharacterized protein (UPF0264 family)|nr:(5-formylfuran-3-yl)methyl phosphate synthase [Terriglobales bacterium]